MTDSKKSGPVETVLTPELAAQLLANPHDRQRRQSPQTVAEYARAIREGRWRLIPDAIQVDPEGRLFNGGHRCAAVISAGISIPVYILWDADPDTFDVIDVNRRRSAHQFITDKNAAARASAARYTLWYGKRFDVPPAGSKAMTFTLHEVIEEVERRRDSFDAMVPAMMTVYDYTRLPTSITLAALSIAYEQGYGNLVMDFVDGVADPYGLDENHPARLLAERFRKSRHRSARRTPTEDWTILVYALNLHFEGKRVAPLVLRSVWPRVGEKLADYNRRSATVSERRQRLATVEKVA